jgi:FtsZ-interacting cell division protein ZipA
MEAIIAIVVIALIVLGLVFVLGKNKREQRKVELRQKAHHHREESKVRHARADRAEAEAEERAARAKREQAMAEEQAAAAERERRFAHEKASTAQELDPDSNGRGRQREDVRR